MLNLNQIEEYFEKNLTRINPKGVIIEYLQYEVLDSLFKQRGSENLSFIGGTAIRIIHNSQRFSEDLDFDNFGLNYNEFKEIMARALKELELKGFSVEERFLSKDKNYHCYIKFKDILQSFDIAKDKKEKIFLSIDVEKKEKIGQSELKIINKFGVFRKIPVNLPQVLLSQKLLAILFRKREKGRDFYDTSFLSAKTKPDYEYIEKITGLDKQEFIDKIKTKCAKLNFKHLANDVEPFLFDVQKKDRVLDFKEELDNIL
ncbi:hypothetical protein A3J90_01225 [candidate division WOR-1 bacterium RIFOXYC2_FULL_37_10]|uniref:Nucleotidyltransferase n=1 Tax=candidate division WOR-1 bacterium RIFOXYB2_FULL_37_13 TaxID=1802579 RepID=A0A1F4SSX2_UNCSA|nr:MAG: hypothetical protein A2246_01130 [candidate division WOR-1 bacterium RIFOXYA2_FULL_37_7]OGC23530.1 MAG: hypothetical protein A2310_02890 [candidate division WOR-1 bacterium RIFOXYB2_FULL_37_13]OGC35743.1 MAG: hypothetical protein A3J90_01225 [candidate division WOR-1 bacterium RIFOXYC2_FULL_37_10]